MDYLISRQSAQSEKRTETHACDLISRRDAIKALGEEPPVWCHGEDEIAERNQWRADVAAIEAVPSAQPKTGEWVDDIAYYDEDGCPCIVSRCNQCGEPNPESNFCPNCGSDMRGDKNG